MIHDLRINARCLDAFMACYLTPSHRFATMSERGASEVDNCTEAAVHASVAPDTLHDATADHEESKSCPDPSMSSAASISSQEAPSTELDTSMYMKVCL